MLINTICIAIDENTAIDEGMFRQSLKKNYVAVFILNSRENAIILTPEHIRLHFLHFLLNFYSKEKEK